MTVGVADGDIVGSVVVVGVDGHNTLGREAMNRREHGCAHQAAVAEWQKVKMVVNQIEGFRLLENRCNMEAFPDLRTLGWGLRSMAVDRRRPAVHEPTSQPWQRA